MPNDSTPSLSCAYLGQYHAEQFRRDLEDIQEAGIKRLYVPMTEEDQELRRPNLEAMARIAGEAGVGIWLIPWGIGGAFSGPAGSRFVAVSRESCQIDSAGETLPAACPNKIEFAYFMEEWIDDAVETGAEGILWNEPHWARHDQLPQYRGLDTARLWACCCWR